MVISGMQKLTLLDYPGKTACLIFTQGCNFRCPFCHNKDLLDNEIHNEIVSEAEVFEYLEKRKNILDGVCITGGEPLLQNGIENFIKKIKAMGLLVKLDTNGSCPGKLKWLLDNDLLDYVAMDIKNDFLNYDKASGVSCYNVEKIKDSINIIEKSKVEHEFRTTVVKQIHDIAQIENICKYLGPNEKYYIQNYRDSETVLKPGLSGFEIEELQQALQYLNKTYPNVNVRGI